MTSKISFLRDVRASFGTMFACCAAGLAVAAGGAVDYGRARVERESIQDALDAAVLAGLGISAREKANGASEVAVATKVFHSVYPDSRAIASFALGPGKLSGTARGYSRTTLMRLVGRTELEVDAKATATVNSMNLPACFMAMNPHRKHTLELKDTVSVSAPQCNIYGNSDDEDDVVDPHNADNYLTGKTVQAVGYGHHFLQNVVPPLAYAPEILEDPLRDFSIPTPGTCTASNTKLVNTTVTLSPGVYCNGLFLTNTTATLAPGTYFVRDADFALTNSRISGTGVTIVLWSGASLQWRDSDIEITAPKVGPLTGIVITGERTTLNHALINSRIDPHGTVYLPKGMFNWTNTGKPIANAKWTSWIIDGVTWRGSGTISINFDLAASSVPFPSALSSVIPPIGPGRLRLSR